MLDDFQDSASFLDEIEEDFAPPLRAAPARRFLGMTPFQRFIISMLLFGSVCIVSVFFLLVMGSINPPFI
jgi:hypothetical protein